MEQLLTESKSLWMIQKEYKKNAQESTGHNWSIQHETFPPDCPDCVKLWSELEKQKEDNIKRLESLIRDYLNKSEPN